MVSVNLHTKYYEVLVNLQRGRKRCDIALGTERIFCCLGGTPTRTLKSIIYLFIFNFFPIFLQPGRRGADIA